MKEVRQIVLRATVVLMVILATSGCVYKIPSVAALDAFEKISPNVAILSNSSQREFWFYTELHGGDGIIRKQEGGASIEPGVHSYQVLVTRRSGLAILILQDMFYRDAVCAFSLDAQPGHTYTLGNVTKAEKVSNSQEAIYRAILSVVEHQEGGQSTERLIEVECASTKFLKGDFVPPSSWWNFKLDLLCSQNSSCTRDGEICRKQSGFQYGICVTK